MEQRVARSSLSLGRSLSGRTKSLVRGLTARRRDGASNVTVSVVVPACDDEADFLDEGLASLRARPQTAVELIVVPHGVCDLIPALADRHAAEDPRVQVLEPVPGSHNEAFDVGARSASGSYLAFAKASDLVPVGGLRRLVLSLEESGSDFALGQLTENVLARTSPRWPAS